MYEVRQIIQRLRLGETDRGIALSQRVGRRTVSQILVRATFRKIRMSGVWPSYRQVRKLLKPQNLSLAEQRLRDAYREELNSNETCETYNANAKKIKTHTGAVIRSS